MEEDGSQSIVGTSNDSKSLEQRQLFEKTELLKSTFDIDSEMVTAIGWKDQYVGIIFRKSILHCEISPNGLLNHQMIDVPESIDCGCYDENGSFLIVGCATGRLHIYSLQNGLLFSQTVFKSEPDSCFVTMQWLSNSSLLIVTKSCQLILISNLMLMKMASILNTDTTSLLSLRDTIQIAVYDFHVYFTSITCLCIEESPRILLGGTGSNALLRVDLYPDKKVIHHTLPAHFFHSSGIQWIQSYGMCILILTFEGDFYVLRRDSLFPLSQRIGFNLRSAAITQSVYSLHPLLLFVQDDGEQHHLFSSDLTFGTPTIIAEELVSPNLHMVLNDTLPMLISIQPNQSSFTLRLYHLTASSCHQHFLRLLQEHKLDDALSFAQRHQLDTLPVYRRRLQELLKQWKDLPHSNWLTAPPVNCEEITAVLDMTSPSLIFYVLASEYLPSASTCERILQYAMHRCTNEESHNQYVEYQRRWLLFRHVMRLETEGSVRLWQVWQQLPLSELQRHFLQRGLVSAVQEMWRIYQNDMSVQASDMRKSVMMDVARYITEREKQSLSIHPSLFQFMEDVIVKCIEIEEQRRFVEWGCEFIHNELQRLQDEMPKEVHILGILLYNLQQVASVISSFPLFKDEIGIPFIMQSIRYESYLRNLSDLIVTYHTLITPSPSAELPSNEELVVHMLDSLQNVALLQLELERQIKPFCELHNMNTDEVFSYYLQQEFENAKELDIRRIHVFWKEIREGDLRVEALKGLTLRSPPYESSLQELILECTQRSDITIENHKYVNDQVNMIALRNRLYDRGMTSLISGGDMTAYGMCEILIHHWDQQTLNDLKLLSAVYDQVHWNDCLVNLLCVMCETENVEISDIEMVCKECEDSECIQSVIRYLHFLLDEQGITEQEWMKRLHILEFLLQSHSQSTDGVSLLRSVFEEFKFRLQSSFLHPSLTASDSLLRDCLQEDGFENSLNTHNLRITSFSSYLTLTTLLHFDVVTAMLQYCDTEVMKAHSPTSDTLQRLTELTTLCRNYRKIPIQGRNDIETEHLLECTFSLILDDLNSAMFSCIHSLSDPSPFLEVLLTLNQVLCEVCVNVPVLLRLKGRRILCEWQNTTSLLRLLALTKPIQPSLQHPSNELYVELGLSMNRDTFTFFLSSFLQHSFDQGDINPEAFAAAVESFDRQQVELTVIPLIQTLLHSQPRLSRCQLHEKKVHPITYLIQRVVRRLLQSLQPDMNAVMIALNALPMDLAKESIQMEWMLNQEQPQAALRITEIGVIFGIMKKDEYLTMLYKEKRKKEKWRCQLQNLTGDTVLSRAVVEANMDSLFKDCDVASILELCQYVLIPPSTAASLIITHSQSDQFESLSQHLTESDLHQALVQSIPLVNGENYEALSYLYTKLLRYGDGDEQIEIQRILNILIFIQTHHIHSINLHTLLTDPWSELSKVITIHNYQEYLLLFSFLHINMDMVIIFLMKQMIHDHCMMTWNVLQRMIEDSVITTHSCDIIRLCLEFSRMYQHPPSLYCETIPCARCMDAIAAAQKASDLSLALMNTAYHKDMTNEKDLTEDWEVDTRSTLIRSCRMRLFSAIAVYQFNRLRLGQNPIPAGILPSDPVTDCQNHFTDLSGYLETLYCDCMIEAGSALQNRYKHIIQNRSHYYSMLYPTEDTRDTHPKKRGALTSIVRSCQQQSFEFTEVIPEGRTNDECVDRSIREWEALMGGTDDVTFLLAPEASGGLFTHSVFYVLSKTGSIGYLHLLETVRERLSRRKDKNEEQIVWSLVYLFEGVIDIDLNLFKHIAIHYIQMMTSAVYSYLQKSRLFEAIWIVLSHFPSSVYQRLIQQCTSKEASLLNPSSIQQLALTMRIRHGCQIYGIPVGNDVLVEVRNPSFLLNILNTHGTNRDVLRWCVDIMTKLSIDDFVVWKSFINQCQVIQFDELGAQCVLDHGVLNDYVIELVPRLLNEISLQKMGLLIMLKYRQELQDKIPTWIQPVLHSQNLTSESIQYLCDLLLDLSESICREGLEILIQKGGSRVVFEAITQNGNVSPKFWTIFGSSVKVEMIEGHLEWLFYCDSYESVIEYCLQAEEKEWIHRWIEFHITSRRLNEAMKLIDLYGWNGSVKEFVEKVLRADRSASDLLCYID